MKMTVKAAKVKDNRFSCVISEQALIPAPIIKKVVE